MDGSKLVMAIEELEHDRDEWKLEAERLRVENNRLRGYAVNKVVTEQDTDIQTYCHEIICGSGGLNDYQRYELVILHSSDREAAAEWTIKCLANPANAKSETALRAIMGRRAERGGVDLYAEVERLNAHVAELEAEALQIAMERDEAVEALKAIMQDPDRIVVKGDTTYRYVREE